jgi:hypothetical protein
MRGDVTNLSERKLMESPTPCLVEF